MPSPDRAVTVVIPTRGLGERAELLWRAVDSVREQSGVRALALVILNGAQRAPEVESALARAHERSQGVHLIVRETADLPAAHRVGRRAVETPWFGALDDDDVLLPGALARRVDVLEEHSECDVVVTNGMVHRDGVDSLHVPPGDAVGADPLRALQRRNWLLPGSWLARRDGVGTELFDDMPRYRECTYLALRFAIEHRMIWLQEPTVRYNVGSPQAESHSHGYLMEQVEALRRILELPLPAAVRRRVRREIAAAFHDMADHHWSTGALDRAWRLHLRSLRAWGGLRYLPFTRHLLGAEWRRAQVRAGWASWWASWWAP